MSIEPNIPAAGVGKVVISVDAMGGDRGPAAVVAGLVESARKNDEIHFILHGDEGELSRLLAKQKSLTGRYDLRHAPRIVTMHDKPSQVMRHGNGTSMWSAIAPRAAGDEPVAAIGPAGRAARSVAMDPGCDEGGGEHRGDNCN